MYFSVSSAVFSGVCPILSRRASGGPWTSQVSTARSLADSVSTRSAGRSRFLCVGTPREVLASHACPSSKGSAVTLLRCITDGLSLRYSVFPQSAPWPLERFSCTNSLPALPGLWGSLKRGNVNAVPKTTAHAAAGLNRTGNTEYYYCAFSS